MKTAMAPINSKMSGWTKAGFPATIVNEKESIKFVKRLVAIGFSHIILVRAKMPQDCFKPHFIGTLDCSMLKAKSGSEAANMLTTELKNAMDALDKGYLRQLIIKMQESKEEQAEIYESYTFNFDKVDLEGKIPASPGFNLTRSEKSSAKLRNGQNLNGSMVQDIVESKDLIENSKRPDSDQRTIYNATKNLLQKLNNTLQRLQQLPNRFFIKVAIGYHDDITPVDYHPNGFHAYSNPRFDENLSPLAVGHVKSNFHEVKMAMTAKALDIPDDASEECLGSPTDNNAALQGESPSNNNTSMIPLQPGLDESGLEETKDSESSFSAKKGKYLTEIVSKPIAMSNRMKELKAVDVGCVGDVGCAGNSLNSSICSTRSPKILNAIRRAVSVRDTFIEEESIENFDPAENVQPKASISDVIAI